MQYERGIVEAGFCGGFVAQWFMAAVRHPGFESRGCRFFAFQKCLSQQAEFHLTFVIIVVIIILFN